MRATSIVLLDDHPLFRMGIAQLLRAARYDVVGEAGTVREARALLADRRPALLIADLILQRESSLAFIEGVVVSQPDLRVLVTSMLDERTHAMRCVRAGAHGFVNKAVSAEVLLAAVDVVLSGRVYLGAEATRMVVEQAIQGVASNDPIASLSNRELEVFLLIGQGAKTGTIAKALHLSTKTVESHQANLKRKLGADDATELLRMAIAYLDGRDGNQGAPP